MNKQDIYTSEDLDKLLTRPPKYGDEDFLDKCEKLYLTRNTSEDQNVVQACHRILSFCNCNYFAVEYLSYYMYDKVEDSFVPPAAFHKEIYHKLNSYKKLIVLAPREHAKSTVVCNFFPTWGVATERYKYVIIICASKKLAVKKMSALRRNFAKNNKIIKYYGKQKTKDGSWSSERLVLKNGAIIEAYGGTQDLKGLVEGRDRPDLILLDDTFTDEELLKNKVRRNDAFDWFFAHVVPLGKHSDIVFVATVGHEDDPGQRLAKVALELPDWEVVRYGAANLGGKPSLDFEGGAEMLWPEKLNKEELLHLYNTYSKAGTIHKFWNEFMNMPQDSKDAIFPRYDSEGAERDIFYTETPEKTVLEHKLRIYQAIDPAYSSKKTADRKVSIIVGVDELSQTWYVLDLYAGRDSLDVYTQEIVKQALKWQPFIIGMEANTSQTAFKQQVEQKARESGVYRKFVELKPGSQLGGKHDRIISVLAPRYLDNRLKFRKGQRVLLDEMWEFVPGKQSKHDDCLDALSYIDQLVIPTVKAGRRMIAPNRS